MLTCKITLPDSPHLIIISEIEDFGHFISVDRMNSVFFSFNKYNKYFFHFWLSASAWKNYLLPKNNGFARVAGRGSCSPQARMPMEMRILVHSNMCKIYERVSGVLHSYTYSNYIIYNTQLTSLVSIPSNAFDFWDVFATFTQQLRRVSTKFYKWTHPTLTPARGRYSIYLPRRDGRLSWPRQYIFVKLLRT